MKKWQKDSLHLLHLEHRVRRLERRTRRKEWRDNYDPFDLDDHEFVKLYRVSPDIATELIDILEPRLQRERPYGLSVKHQVQIILHLCSYKKYFIYAVIE